MSVRNIKNLQYLSMADTMLNEESFLIMVKNLPANLSALNLSHNEHLTPECLAELHKV